MMHRRKALACVTAAFLFLPHAATAEDNLDACGAVLCLVGELAGAGGGSSCKGYIAQYFAIQYWKKGRFKPNPTAAARLDFLSQCKSADPNTINSVNEAFGRQLGL